MVEVYGTAGPVATHSFDGKTDPQIARELLLLAGVDSAAIDAGLPDLWQRYTRQLRIELDAPGHRTVVLLLTEKKAERSSLGSLVSLRAHACRVAREGDRYRCTLQVLKDKRGGRSGGEIREVCRGPDGLS